MAFILYFAVLFETFLVSFKNEFEATLYFSVATSIPSGCVAIATHCGASDRDQYDIVGFEAENGEKNSDKPEKMGIVIITETYLVLDYVLFNKKKSFKFNKTNCQTVWSFSTGLLLFLELTPNTQSIWNLVSERRLCDASKTGRRFHDENRKGRTVFFSLSTPCFIVGLHLITATRLLI